MKKKLLVLLLVLVAVVCFAAFSASAEEEHVHCVCGGSPIDADYHSCADVTWEPLPEGTTDFGKLAKGNYYLTGDVTVTAYSQIKVDLKICLNGHNINTTAARVFGNTRTASAKLTITDCSYNAATKTWGGTITGGDSSNGYGSILYTHYSSVVNIYGGNFTGNGKHIRMGGLFVVAQDGAPDTKDENGTVTLKGTSDPTKAATLNLYGGKIYGGLAGTGGAIHVMHCGKMNMYGGTITDNKAKFVSWTASGSTSYKYGQGGNIYTDAATVVHIYDGVITNGIAQHGGNINSTNAVGSGGNIYACGDLYIHGGVISNGYAEQNTRLKDGAYIKSSGGTAQTEIDGRGGNIYAVRNLTISGGQIYDGKANGNGGGNIYYNAKDYTFTISGGMIWGGEANADKDAKGTNIVNAYDVCGGSIRIQYGTFNMTGGSIGIDADGKPAGGTTYPSGSEAGNIYMYSSSITANLSGGKIAYGNVIGLDAEGNEIYGVTSKGGNIGGSASATYSDNIEVFGGYSTGNGGNITMFNNGNAKIKGGKIYDGKTPANGGNISMSGSGTTVHTLEITGGEIYGGTADKGGNIYIEVYKAVEISGDVKIYDGVAATAGGNIGMYTNSKLDIGEGVKLTGSETLQDNGANIYASGTITINIDGAELVGGYTTGNGANIFTGSAVTLNISNSTVKDGKSSKNGGSNLYATGKITLTNVDFSGGESKNAGGSVKFSTNASEATLTGCTFDGGISATAGGNLYSEGTMTLENCTFKNGQAGTFGGNLSVGDGSVTTITNCTFENGTAGDKGGNIGTYNNATSLTMTDCTLKDGIATNTEKVITYGGNMFSTANTLTINGGTFENGIACHAGNLYTGSGTIVVTGATFKNGVANLNLDGKGNGNGGNVDTASDGDSTFIGCTFEGGEALRGGSVACFGKTTLTNCTIGAGTAANGGGTLFIYENGYATINGTTTIAGGTCKDTGGAIHMNSFGTKAGNNVIADSVKVTAGSAKDGVCIYLAAGNLELKGDVDINAIYVLNTKDVCIIADELTSTKDISVAAVYAAEIGTSATDKSKHFVYNDGYVMWNNGVLELVVGKTGPFKFSLSAGRTHNVALYNVGEQVMTIPNVAGGAVIYNGETYEADENGTITITFPAGMRGAEYLIKLVNDSDASLTFDASFAFPVGHMENPDTLVIGENTANITAGNTTGYNYTYTAEKTGNLVITMDGAGWMYCINNLTTYQYGDTVVYVDGSATAEIAVTEGDLLQIMVNTFDPANPFAAAAGTITFTAEYATYVAEANGVKYETLTEALAQGGTVTLLKDITLTEKVVVEGTVTLNLGGCTLTTYAENGNYGFVVKGNLTIEGEGNMVVNGVYGIGVLGELTVNGGTFTTSADSDYMIGNFGTTTINGGSFTGIYNVLNNFQGTSTVTGGTFVTAETDATGEYEACDLFADAGLTVTGGTFSKNVNEYCAQGLAIAPNGDGTYGVVEAVAEADGLGYATLTEALAQGGNVTLLKDITLTEKVAIEGTVTLNLGGKTLTTYAENGNYGFVVKGDLTIEGEGNMVVNGVYGIGVLGNLTVNGGTFTTSADSDYMIGNFGTTTINGGSFTGIYNVLNNFQGTSTVTGGTFVTAEFDATGEYEACDLFADAGLTVTGGTFSKDVTVYCAPYLAAFDNGDGTWYIGDAAGSQNNPIMVEWTWNEEQTEATASVTVPAGLTYHYTAYVSGMELTINGEVYGILNGSRWMPATFTVTNDTEEEATFELKIYYPIGTQGNPAELVIGENTATIAEGNNQGYFFTYTATETGALVITMPAGDWMYVINNMTTYQYGDMQWSDSDPVVNPAVVSVNEGDVLEIMVNSYDPANPWSNPAAEITFTAATSQYVAQVGDKQYVDLATAVKEANGETVVLLQDLVLTEKLVLEGTATLDMNWCTITTAAVEGNYGVVVKGNLTLDGYGTWNVNGVYGIGVTGSLNVKNGYFYAAENNDYMIGNWGTTTIEGGMYYGIYCVVNNFAGTTVIDGGEFNTEEFDCTGAYESCDVMADAGLTIISGMFSKDVTEYCAEGKVCTDTGYGMYTVNDPVGTETNPVVFYDLENTVVNTGTMYYMTYSDGMIMTITGEEGYSLTIGGETIVPEGGVYTTVVTQIDYLPMTFAITGEGTFTVNFVYPVGAVENPDTLVIGENTTSVDENSWGYYYTWTATGNGTLTITGTEGMQYVVSNLTSYIYGEYVYGAESYSVAVAEGDEIQVSVNTHNPESMWETPAGDITFTAAFEAEGGNEPEGPVVGEGVTATPDEPIMIEYTAETAGVLSVTVSGTPGFKVEVYDANGETVGLPATGKAEETLTYELTAGTYTIRMVGYANWDEASATINYSISFTADEGGETEKAEYEVDYNTTLVVGDNTITLLDTAITTIYAFEPTEEGTYTITAPEGAIVGYWGAGEWFLFDPMSTTNSTEWKCTSVGQNAYIGISGIEGEFTVTVEKTAEGQGQEQIEYLVYENVHTFPEGFNTLTGEETLLNVNITEAHTAVLGDDGYYHLDSATGPVLYVDLQTESFDISVAAAPGGANVMRGEVDGVKYDFLSAMTAYNSCDVYPLTEDTMKFIQGYGKYQGWFVSGMSPFAEINEGTANADTAWMVLCRYVEVQEPEIEKFEIDVARMILGNALEFQFGVAKTKIDDKANYYALIEKTWADGTTTTETIPGSQWDSASQYWAIVYDGLAAKEMGDTFYVTIYNADGVAVSETRTDSVRAYVERAYASQKVTGKTMMVDMLNYGAAAQVHFGYGTDDLANNKLTAEQLAAGTATAPTMENKQVKGDNYQGTRFILESRIQVQLAFKNMTTDMYAIYTYTDAAGTAQTVRVEGKDFVVIDGKPAGVELSALVYADARALVEVTLYNADGTVYGTATDSIESCALRSTGDVFVALMKFADSAEAHLYG